MKSISPSQQTTKVQQGGAHTTKSTSEANGELDERDDETNGDECEEMALVARAQAGDRAAFRVLYERHASTVFRCAILPLVRDRAQAEDLLADTFLRAMENLHRFSWRSKSVLPWLIRIGKNLCFDYLRRRKKVGDWPEGLEQRLADSASESAEKVLGRHELGRLLGERIAGCLEEINPRYRRVLELRLIEKRERQEAAELMDVTIGTLDVLLFRACKAFRKVYLRRYESDAPEGILVS